MSSVRTAFFCSAGVALAGICCVVASAQTGAPAHPNSAPAATQERGSSAEWTHVPLGWNPSAIGFSPEGRLLSVTNAKGKGAGPNGGKNHDPNAPTYVGTLDYGRLSIVELGKLPAPDALTKTVAGGNLAAVLSLEDGLAGDVTDIFDTEPHLEPFHAVAADPRVFVPANAKIAKPKTRAQAAELRDMDNSEEIRKEMDRARSTLHRPANDE